MNDRYANRKGLLGLLAIIALVVLAASLGTAQRVALAPSAVAEPNSAMEDAYVREPLPSAEEIAKLPPDGGPEFNRLVFETSPYLLQHARNPVDWHPWSVETLELAKSQGKPIFMSVGYSTCHWCHVMARESFSADDVAQILNAHYIPVKVDREEMPDVDATYMTATQLLTGSGGWPNSVWMTPEGKPFFARTYVPRSEFKQILLQLKNAYEQRNAEIEEIAAQMMSAIEQTHALEAAASSYEPSAANLQRVVKQAQTMYDAQHGGLGSAPKFPPHGFLTLLAYELHRRPDNEQALRMFTHTLDKMARGGIRDHLGGGFHRYSTDHLWMLPHFEKMLYDNAQLARVYTDAWLITGEERYREVAEATCDWILREMTDPAGGFYSAQDAESEGEEGKSYVWTPAEVQDVLGRTDGELFARAYGFSDTGNFIDEASGLHTGANVVYLPRPLAEIAEQEGIEPESLNERLSAMRLKLLEARGQRPQPHTDDKVLTNWNGLTIGALAYAGKALGREDYVAAAERAAQFALTELQGPNGLMHTWRVGEARVEGHSDDYACLIDGLLDLHIATDDERWLAEAEVLAVEMQQRFRDDDGALFYTAASTDTSLLRRKDSTDDVIPSGNGMAARVLARLAALTGDEQYDRQARALLAALSGTMEAQPIRTESLHLGAAMLAEGQATPGRPLVQQRARSADGPLTILASVGDAGNPGGTVDLVVELEIEGQYHVNASVAQSVGGEDLIPITLELNGPAWVAIDDRLVSPEPVMLSFPGHSGQLPAYEGSVRFVQPLTIPDNLPPGNYDLTVKVQAQPCDDRACLLPQMHELPLTLVVR